MTAAMGQETTAVVSGARGVKWLQRTFAARAGSRTQPAASHHRRGLCLRLADQQLLHVRTFNRIASSVSIITVVAVGQTLVVLTRNIDLSVGSIVGCTAYFAGSLVAGP